jgi:hypothetical protein
MFRPILEGIAGVGVIILGILFIEYLQPNASNLATDVIFLGAGVLIIRRAYRDYKKPKIQPQPVSKKNAKQNQKQQANKRK